MIEFDVLGPMRVRVNARPIDISAGQLQRMLLLLLAARGVPVRLAALADALWDGRPPAAAKKTIQVYVHRLRRLLGEGLRLRYAGGGYALDIDPDACDAHRYERLVTDGRRAEERGDTQTAWLLLGEAEALWRGEPFADVRHVAALDTERRRLVDLRRAAIAARAAAGLELRRIDEVVSDLTPAIAEHPFHEALRAQLMLALYRGGRRAEALELYRSTDRLFRDELGVEPMAELQRLHEQILRDDLALSQPSPKSVHGFRP